MTYDHIPAILESTLSQHIKDNFCLAIVAQNILDPHSFVWGENYKTQQPYLDFEESRYKISKIIVAYGYIQIAMKLGKSSHTINLRDPDWILKLNEILLK